MNKVKGIVCYSAGILLSVLTYVWFALAGAVSKVTAGGKVLKSVSQSVYDLFSGDGSGLGKTSIIFAIIALVFATLLAIACVLGLLKNFGILKGQWISWTAIAVAALFVVAALVSMICMMVYCADKSGEINIGVKATLKASCGVGLILPFVSSVLALISTLVAKLKK